MNNLAPIFRRFLHCLLTVAFIATAMVPVSAQTRVRKATAASAANSNRDLGVGDMVTYRVLEDRDPPVQLIVSDTGELDIPYLGRFRAVGKSTAEVKRLLKKRLEKDYYYTATVQLAIDTVGANTTTRAGKVYLSGKVRTPGPQELIPGEQATAGKVILRAGGLGEYADSRKVKIVRKGKGDRPTETIIVDLREVLERGNIDQDVEVFDGDLIIVKQKMINW